MKVYWERVGQGLYASDIGAIIREHDGWTLFRVAPPLRQGGFKSYHAAKRWAEANVPGLMTRTA